MDKAFIYLANHEGDSWVRADMIVGLYLKPGGKQTEVHLNSAGVVSVTMTDLTPVQVLRKLQKAWEFTND